jgi:biotin transport system substrate-specific component
MHNTLAVAVWPQQSDNNLLRYLLFAVTGSLLLTATAKISVPFYPVPLTMQTFVLLAMGMVFGWRLGCASVLLYLAEGAAGLPVFSGSPEKGIGLVYMMGGTGGYLLGFIFAVAVCGYLAERGWDRIVWTTALTMLLGNIAIYVPGLLWLGVLFGWDKPILEWGLMPFILGDVAKIALAAIVLPTCWKLVGNKLKK